MPSKSNGTFWNILLGEISLSQRAMRLRIARHVTKSAAVIGSHICKILLPFRCRSSTVTRQSLYVQVLGHNIKKNPTMETKWDPRNKSEYQNGSEKNIWRECPHHCIPELILTFDNQRFGYREASKSEKGGPIMQPVYDPQNNEAKNRLSRSNQKHNEIEGVEK